MFALSRWPIALIPTMRLTLLLPLAALALVTSCGMPRAGLDLRLMDLDVDGDIFVTQGAATSSADVESLGLQKDSGTFSPRADFEWGGFHVSASQSSTDHSGSGTVDSTLEYNGIMISSGENVQTDFDLGLTNVLMTWDLIPSDMFELGIGFGAMLMDLDANIMSTDNPGNNIDLDEQIPIPLLVGRAGIEVAGFDLEGVLGGLSVNVDGDEATVLDLDVTLSYELIDIGGSVYGSILVCYRSFDIDVQYDDDDGAVDFDSSFSGPYFGINISL